MSVVRERERGRKREECLCPFNLVSLCPEDRKRTDGHLFHYMSSLGFFSLSPFPLLLTCNSNAGDYLADLSASFSPPSLAINEWRVCLYERSPVARERQAQNEKEKERRRSRRKDTYDFSLLLITACG